MSFGFGLSFPAWATLSGRIAAFSPASLFSSGEQGGWWDPSDTTTLFQDSAGVTPVTAVEQPVGLILDKSKGLVLGSELVTNGDFSGGTTGWTLGSGWAVTGNALIGTNVASGVLAIATNFSTTVSGVWYEATFVVSAYSSGTLQLLVFNGSSNYAGTQNSTSAGTYKLRFLATTTTAKIYVSPTTATAFNGTVALLSIKALPGNHAYQTDPLKRPLWSSRVNLLQRTEEFENAYWVKAAGVSVTANTDIAPDGTTTADTITSGGNQITGEIAISANTLYTESLYFKKTSGATYQPGMYLQFYGGTAVVYAVLLNTNTGVATPTSFTDPAVYSVVERGDYWQLSITGNSTNNLYGRQVLYPNMTLAGGIAPGSQVIWGADLRVANESSALPPYQRVVTATDYDTTGFVPFLRFDGSNDALVTNSIDFTATDEMSVFAGVRKLVDGATYGTIAELSAAVNGNAGSFLLAAPGSPAPSFYTNALYRSFLLERKSTEAALAAPVTNAITTLFDFSQAGFDQIVFRRNGAVGELVTQVGTTAGTGNFGNYPLYIGARAGTLLPYNGRLHSLIVLGRTVTPTELTQTEGYVEAKTFGKDMNYVYSVPILDPDGNQLLVTAGGDPLFMNVNYE